MVLHYDGRYRSVIECKFLEQAEEELTKFWSSCSDNSVLVFPPLSARYRFLIHQLVGAGSRLQTVSVGQGRQRRTVVYFATEREPEKMAQSPSTSQRTFFGRGRGRRPKRPDQALYVPGALRQAKLNQLKQNPDTESSTNITENKEISNSKQNDDDVASTIFTTPKGGHDCIKPGNSSVHEAKMDGFSYDNVLSVSERAADSITEGTDSTSFDANVQHKNTSSHLSEPVSERLQSDNKEPNRENVAEDSSGSVVVISVKSSEAQIKVEGDERVQIQNTPSHLSESDNERLQSENNEPNRETTAENDSDLMVAISEKSSKALAKEPDDKPRIRDKGDERAVRTEQSVINDDQSLHMESKTESSAGENDHNRDVVVNCGISQTLSTTGNNSVDESLLAAAVEKCDDANEEPLVENISVPRQNQEMESSQTSCGSVPTILPTEESNSLETETQSSQDVPVLEANGDTISVEQNVETEEETETKEAADCSPVDVVSDRKVEHDESWIENKIMFWNDSVNKENSEVLTCTISGAFDHKEEQEHGVVHFDDVSVSELSGNQSKVLREEVIEETSICENTVNSENNPTLTLDVVRPPSSIDDDNLEAESSTLGLGNSVNITNEKVQAMPEKIVDVPESMVTELSENVGELETEQQKPSKNKKKVKKDKSKDLKEDKIKLKEKGEKKKKKEKKSVKDKNDKEVNIESEMQIRKEKKSKTKEQSTKQQRKKDLSACEIDTGQELTGESCSKNDDDIDDDDNWESNFDESGDCLNPDYLEELSRLTGISNPEVHKTQYDYYSFKPKDIELDDEEFGHILEIYNFSSELTTQDLMQALSSFRSKGFDIKWVDDTHALAVFASRLAAQDAIKLCSGPLMKLRPVSEGTTESKKKANYCFEFLQPIRERPQTSKLLADRLVTGALGMRSKMTREERVKEREKIKEAKNKRQQEKIQKAQIWGD
ncbi:hypothetical protein ACROYT_G005806 [Oculina patagonica]